MNNNIINQYQISFQNNVVNLKPNGNQILKTLEINNFTFGTFLIAWCNADDITDLLIPDINDVLDGVSDYAQNGSETITIGITPDVVTFYIDDVGTNYPTLPTTDFLQIVTLWRDFLSESPKNGTPVGRDL